MQRLDFFKNKKVTVMGLGLLGRGVGDVEFLAKHGADLIVTDLKTESELEKSLARLRGFSNIKFVLGEHRLEDFRDRDFILKAAGVPLDSIFIKEAEKNGVPVEMSTALFAEFSGAKIIGITGTRGKSTVTQMIFETLEAERREGGVSRRVFLGGNVRGVSTLALLDEVGVGDIAVLELDSWQLQGFRSRGISPSVAVFTTFMPDHMNYYKEDLRAYFFDKAAIYENQQSQDVLVMSDVVAEFAKGFGLEPKNPQIEIVAGDGISELPELSIPGEHNRLSAHLALRALRAIGVEGEAAMAHLAKFKGVPGRLEKIAEKNEVEFYNDTTATTPEAAVVAIEALRHNHGIVLIAGGSDKGLDFSPLAQKIYEGVSRVVFLPGHGTNRLVEELKKVGYQFREASDPRYSNPRFASSMQEAVELATIEVGSGMAILLSPGCASFGLFKNEFDRGDQFVEAVKKL